MASRRKEVKFQGSVANAINQLDEVTEYLDRLNTESSGFLDRKSLARANDLLLAVERVHAAYERLKT